MLEQNIEGGVAVAQPKAPELEGGDGNGKKSDSQILTDNRLGLYNEILKLKEKGFSDEYKKIGYKKFNQLLETNSDFRTDLLNDLNERGFNIAPGDFESAYVKGRKDEVYDFGAPAYTTTIKTDDIATPVKKAPVEEPVGDGTLDQIKGLAKSAYNYGKDFYNIVKRDFYTGQAQRGAQVEDFLTGDVDTENLAKYLKKANEVGEIGIEAAYAKDEGDLKDAADLMAMLGPAIVGSFASMTAAGWDKMAGITAAGAATGAVAGSTVLPGLGTGAGALAGAGRGAQVAMVQQGYNLEFTSSVIDDLTEKGAINPNADEATLKKQLDAAFANKDLMKPIYEKAHTRAGIIMGVDIAASGIGGKVIGTLRRAAMSKPVARTVVGRVLQQSARQIAQTAPVRNAVRLAERASQVSDRFAKSQIGKPIAKVASDIDARDMLAGGGGEALAQLKTEGEINWDETVLEAGAEGSYIKALRSLANIGNKKKELKALPPNAGPKGLLTTDKDEDIEYVAVTDEEYANYKKGDIDPQRAAGIVADVDIALEDPSHLERLKADGDNLYYEMVLDAFNKHIVAVENQKLYNVALSDIAELYSKTPDEIKAAITPNSPSFDEKIHKDFSNSFNVLQKQYREKAKNDSENAAGVSSEGGIRQESQQTQSQQGAGQEAAGDGGIFQEAEGEGRIAEIDDLLAEDDSFFAQNNERLLSPEERADLEQERSTLVAPAAATAGEVAATEVATTTTPAGVASSEVATEQTPSSTPVVEETEVVSETVPAPEIGVQGIIKGYKNIAGDKGIGDVRDLLLNTNNGTQVIRGRDDNWYAISFSRKGGDGEGIYEQGGSTPRPGHIVTSVKINNPESKESIELAKQQSKEALDKILPTIKGGNISASAVQQAITDFQTKKPAEPAPAPKGKKKETKPAETKEGKKAEAKEERKEASFKGIASFETAKGSVYTVLPDGRTQRFKTATKEQNEPQDLTVFVKFKDAAQEQDFLEGIQRSETSGTKVYVIDKQGNKYDTNAQAAGKDVRLALVKDGKVIDTAETSTTPKIGYNTFDQRRFEKDGEKYRQAHLGNKVVKINEQTKTEAKEEKGRVPKEPTKKGVRFEKGKKLTEEEKKEVYKNLKDSYKEMKRPYTIETRVSQYTGRDYEARVWLENASDYMQTSDVTGRKLRYYIFLPDGTLAHPTEIFPNISPSEMTRVQRNVEYNERQANEKMDDITSQLKKSGEIDKVVKAIETALKNGAEFVKEYDSGDVGQKNPFSVLLRFPNGSKWGIPEYVINTQNSILGFNQQDAIKNKTGESREKIFDTNYQPDWEQFYNNNKQAEGGKPTTEAAAKPAPKEAQAKDVEVRKGKTHATDGVYEAVYKGKVIGKFSFDKKEKVWVDAAGDKFAQKKDAISKFVLQYNMKSEAGAETSTAKGEGKGKAAPAGKAEAAPTTETKGEVKPTGKKETKPQTPKTNPFAETVREGMEALMGAIGSKVKMNFLSPEEAAKIAAMPEKKRGKLLFQTTAWHGTPHTFSKFKTEKINTGEQAQAFGWGLYFTDDKEVAEYYANELAGLKENITAEEVKRILPPSPNFESLANNLQRNVRVRGINEGVQKFKEDVELLGEDSYTPEELEFVKNLKQEDVQTKNVYKVTLFKGKKRYVTAPIKSSDGKWNVYDSVVWDKIQAMPSIERQGILDNFDKVKPQKRFNSKEEASNWIADNNEYTWLVWDKRVDKAQVKGLLLQLTKDQLKKFNNSFFAGLPLDATNQDLYYGLKRALGGAEQASMFLLENGIDGVKYPAKSVGTGITSDTARDFNYVVFDENAITIEERNGETIPIQVAVGYRGIRGEYRADYNGIQYFAVNERYAKVFGNNIIKASISTDKILDLDKYNKLLEEKGLETFGNEGFFTIDYSIFDEDGNFSADSMLGSMGRAKAQIGLKEFDKIYDQFVKEFNNADVIYGEDIGNPGEKVYAVKNPNAINTNNVDAAAPEGVQYMKTPDGKILGFVQKLPDGSYNVYINPETQDAETPVHEIAGHIFLPLIKESNPELYNQGTALIQNSEYMGKANGDIEEALALAVGDKGKLLAEKPRKGFMEWLKGMWQWVGDKLRLNPEKIKNLTLGQFTDLIAGSVLKGKELAGTKPTETAEVKPTQTATPAKVPSFSEFDAISADRSKMKEAKAEFIAKHGQLAYDAMKEISANFTKITKALQEKEILTKKC